MLHLLTNTRNLPTGVGVVVWHRHLLATCRHMSATYRHLSATYNADDTFRRPASLPTYVCDLQRWQHMSATYNTADTFRGPTTPPTGVGDLVASVFVANGLHPKIVPGLEPNRLFSFEKRRKSSVTKFISDLELADTLLPIF